MKHRNKLTTTIMNLAHWTVPRAAAGTGDGSMPGAPPRAGTGHFCRSGPPAPQARRHQNLAKSRRGRTLINNTTGTTCRRSRTYGSGNSILIDVKTEHEEQAVHRHSLERPVSRLPVLSPLPYSSPLRGAHGAHTPSSSKTQPHVCSVSAQGIPAETQNS